MRSVSLPKVSFVLSLAILGMAYGLAAAEQGWFPSRLAKRAWLQAQRVLPSSRPPFLHERVYDRSGARPVRPRQMQPGLTLVTSAWPGGDGWKVGLKLIGDSGTVYHEWLVGRTELFPPGSGTRKDPARTDLQGNYLFPNGDVLVALEYVGLARLDACGRVKWRLNEGAHHSISRGAGDSFWVPGVSERPRVRTKRFPNGFPGLGDDLWMDRILQVSPGGRLLRDINVLEVLYENDLEYLFFKYRTLRGDVTHLNDIEPLLPSMASSYPLFEAGDLLVSLRYLNTLLVMDPATREVKWHGTGPFIAQHDPDFIGDGWIGVFDNNRDYSGGRALGGSRIVALRPRTGETDLLFPADESGAFYTELRGKWQRLANGNLLLTEAQAGRALEVDSTGRTVWEWLHRPTEDNRVPAVTKAQRLHVTPAEVASWPCSPGESAARGDS